MSAPQQILQIQDPGLGFVQQASTVAALIGVSSGGTANAVVSFTDPQDVVDALGEGPLVQLACSVLKAGGKPVRCVRCNTTTAAANSAVVQVGSGPAVTLSGTAKNDYDATVEMVLGGALGTATFKYTLDGGETWSPVLTTTGGGTYLMPSTGVTLTFAAGTHVAGTTHTFTCTCAIPDAGDLQDAIAALAGTEFRFIAIAGKFATATASAAAAAGVATEMASLESAFYHRRCMMDCGSNETAADVLTDFVAVFSDKRVAPVFGECRMVSSAGYRGYGNPMVSVVNAFAVRAAASLPSTDLARFASGALIGVTEITYDGNTDASGLDDAHVGTLRTFPHANGFYITNCYLASPPGSDFLYWQHGIVFDIACDTAYEAQLPYMNASVRVLTDGTGKINPLDAADINRVVETKLRAQLSSPINAEGRAGHVSGLSYRVDEDYDVLNNNKVRAKLRIVPLGYIKTMETNVGFAVSVA